MHFFVKTVPQVLSMESAEEFAEQQLVPRNVAEADAEHVVLQKQKEASVKRGRIFCVEYEYDKLSS